MRFHLLIGAVVWHLSSSEARSPQPDRSRALHAVTASANTFDANFLKHVGAAKEGNLVCSSLSAWMVLSMASYGASGTTKSQMQRALALPPSDDDSKRGFEALVDSLRDYNISEVRVANKIFVGHSIRPKSAFMKITRERFHSEVQNVNFADGPAACKDINDWCENQTNNRIKDLMKPDRLGPTTVMVLANAVYFKGKWAKPFNTAYRMSKGFNVDSSTAVDVPIMTKEGYYRTGRINNLEASFIEIPYKSAGVKDALSMFILLPWAVDGLVELEEELNRVTVDNLLGANKHDVEMRLPKFRIESEISLEPIVKNMGMTYMVSESANFSGIVDSPAIKISEIVQKAFIEVTEEGTEAAAATQIGADVLSTTEKFEALHPFVGFIAAPHPSAVKIFTFRYTGPTDQDFLIGARDPSEEVKIPEVDRSEALRPVTASLNTFAPNFHKHVAATTKGNLVCSSLSAWMVLSMASYGASGTTRSQMQRALALPPSDDESKRGFEALVDSFGDYKFSEVRVGNKIFVGRSIRPKSAFKKITRETFHSEVQNVNFTDGPAACKDINDWCANQTNNRIKDLMKPDGVDSSTVMVLANAVYFKGKWAKAFSTQGTRSQAFNVNSSTVVDIPVMYREGYYKTGKVRGLDVKFIEIPYQSAGQNDLLSMFILLPKAVDGLTELEEKLNQVTVDDLLGGTRRIVDLHLPKFRIESEISLEPIVQNMGMTDMFCGSAGFCGIVDCPAMRISKIVQKAIIEVSEEGAADGGEYSPLYTPKFNALHPFMGFIAAPRPSAPKLFTFRYTGPTGPGLHYYLDTSTPVLEYDYE